MYWGVWLQANRNENRQSTKSKWICMDNGRMPTVIGSVGFWWDLMMHFRLATASPMLLYSKPFGLIEQSQNYRQIRSIKLSYQCLEAVLFLPSASQRLLSISLWFDFIYFSAHFRWTKINSQRLATIILITKFFLFHSLQEVGSIIGKKGEIVNRFREEVSFYYRLIYLFFSLSLSLSRNNDVFKTTISQSSSLAKRSYHHQLTYTLRHDAVKWARLNGTS